MRKVKFKRWIPRQIDSANGGKTFAGTNCWESEYTHEGVFHSWGFQSSDNGETMTMDSIAIIELPDGTVESVYPFNVKFI